MTRRSVRVAFVCLGFLLTAGFGYRVGQDERRLTVERDHAATLERSIDEALRTLADVRGALHAYVAPGQRSAAWTARTASLVDALRQRLISLDAATAPFGASLAESLDNLDQLTAAEKRVQHYLDFAQPLLAGDVIFTEVRDLVDATGQQVTSVRDTVRREASGRIEPIRREQGALVLGSVALWMLPTLLLVFAPLRREMAAPKAPQMPSVPEGFDLSLADAGTVAKAGPTVAARDPLGPARWKAVAGVCSDMSSLGDLGAFSGVLARACEVLGASDAIVWVASADGGALTPRAAHGFDSRVLARIGAVTTDSANLTAKAFRDGAARYTAATSSAPAALAVAMNGPSGPVGVFSAELLAGQDIDESVALARIFAAQLATLPLVGSTSAPAGEPSQRRQAQG